MSDGSAVVGVVNYYPFLNFVNTEDRSNEGVRLSIGKLLTSTLPFYILRFILLYLLIAGIWIVLLQNVINDAEKHAPVFVTAFGLISFALSFIYWLWIQEGLNRMFKKPEIYEKLLSHAESLGRNIVQMLNYDVVQKNVTDPTQVCRIIEEIRMLICADIRSFTFVMLNDPANMKNPKKHTVRDLYLTKELQNELCNYNPEDELEISHYIGDMIEDRIKKLRIRNVIEGSAALFAESLDIDKDLRAIRTDREKQSYEFVNLFMMTALTIVVIFFPYIIWPNAHVYTLLVYPILMFIITGLPIAILWYGDAFEGIPGQNAIDYKSKENRSSFRVYNVFERYFEKSNCNKFEQKFNW